MRTLVHPGTAQYPRIVSVPAVSRGVHLQLRPGPTILEQLTTVLRELGTDSGYVELYSGRYEPVSYCIPAVGTTERAISYSETRGQSRAELVYGAATVGIRDGQPFMHSHCLWQDEYGTNIGGHLWLETAAGNAAPRAAIYALYGAQWVSDDDRETNMPVFTPYTTQENAMIDFAPLPTGSSADCHSDQRDVLIDTVVARVLPNEDIITAIYSVCEAAGFEAAVVRAGIGSLIGGTFYDRASGSERNIDGPGTEIISLIGDVSRIDGEYRSRLSCTLVDRHGVVHAGELVPGKNPVAVTFELVVQRIAPTLPNQ